MRYLIVAAALSLPWAVPAAAQEARQLGVGVLLGDPTSGSLKYWLNDTEAVDFGIGVSEDLVLHADYVYHGWDLLPQTTRGKLAAYGALGGRLEFEDHTDFGIRTMAGLSYWPKFKRPVEFFLELGPVVRLTEGARVTVDGGFGLRFYFEPRKKA